MKIAIVGNRTIDKFNFTYDDFCKKIEFVNRLEIYDTIISGGATGIDSFAKKYACECGLNYIEFLPNWKKYGRSAGPKRNQEIVNECDKLIAFWGGDSKGTKSSINLAIKAGKLLRTEHLSLKDEFKPLNKEIDELDFK